MNTIYKLHQIKVRYFNIINYIYIIVDNSSKKAVIIDPSWEVEVVMAFLNKLDVEVVAILLTHSHSDHVNMVDDLLRVYNPNVYMSHIESNYYNYSCKNLIKIYDGTLINVDGIKIRCFLTPGHTMGSTCYLIEENLFTGDTIFIEGCGICIGNGASANDMFNSIQRIKAKINPNVRIYPGHSFGKEPGCKLSYLLNRNIYFQFKNQKNFAEFRNRKNQKNLFSFK